ncbi:hypothetical protein RRG08_032025 [Elysia crispata]|uniref:Uncharacterized protein n=1 Tax=Elysia crispata TaxID=231223 RepID=A0AAE0XWW1_9GAST|nr:hypothetical protein RRG08_032025 [Elysia crispata]
MPLLPSRFSLSNTSLQNKNSIAQAEPFWLRKINPRISTSISNQLLTDLICCYGSLETPRPLNREIRRINRIVNDVTSVLKVLTKHCPPHTGTTCLILIPHASVHTASCNKPTLVPVRNTHSEQVNQLDYLAQFVNKTAEQGREAVVKTLAGFGLTGYPQ